MGSLMGCRGPATSLPCSSISRLWCGSISSGDLGECCVSNDEKNMIKSLEG